MRKYYMDNLRWLVILVLFPYHTLLSTAELDPTISTWQTTSLPTHLFDLCSLVHAAVICDSWNCNLLFIEKEKCNTVSAGEGFKTFDPHDCSIILGTF